jgi:hypothetical protein
MEWKYSEVKKVGEMMMMIIIITILVLPILIAYNRCKNNICRSA